MPKELLQGNKRFREEVFVPKNLSRLAAGQSPHTCWIGCSDSRVPASMITGADAGDLFVHRNIANIVPPNDPSAGAVLEYAVGHLKVKRIALCGHYNCGGLTALWRGPEKGTLVGDWLQNASKALKRVRAIDNIDKLPEPKAIRLLVEENLRVQKDNLLTYPFVRAAVKKGTLDIDLIIYDLETGRLKKMKV